MATRSDIRSCDMHLTQHLVSPGNSRPSDGGNLLSPSEPEGHRIGNFYAHRGELGKV